MQQTAQCKRFGIIADDLTGAMDTAVGFAKIGLDTIISFGDRIRQTATVVVVSTDSRADDPHTAYRKARREAAKFLGLYVYKKIDSTLRGNIGTELRALMDTLGTEKAIVCPAFPANERTVVDGRLLVDNVPVNETYFANDPSSPVTEAHIPTLLHRQCGFQVGTLELEEVRRGPSHIAQYIADSDHSVLVVDAAEQIHVRYLAEALALGSTTWLPCGSAGLAGELPIAFGHRSQDVTQAKSATSGRPVLLVIGSRNDATIKQLRKAEASLRLPLIAVEPDQFLSRTGRTARMNQLAREVGSLISYGKSAAITTTLSCYTPALKDSAASILAAIAVKVIERWELGGLILSGGDIARATCEALKVTGVRPTMELQPGIAVGDIIGGTREGLRIITKAGGFGNEDAIVEAVRCLEGKD